MGESGCVRAREDVARRGPGDRPVSAVDAAPIVPVPFVEAGAGVLGAQARVALFENSPDYPFIADIFRPNFAIADQTLGAGLDAAAPLDFDNHGQNR